MKHTIFEHLRIQLMAEGAEGADGMEGQVAAAEGEEAQPENLEAEFDKLVKGEGKFREVFGKRVQKAAYERSKGMKSSVDRLNALGPGLEVLAARYGMAVEDPALAQRIAQDKSLLEDLAMRNGRDTDAEMELTQARAQAARAQSLIASMLAQQDAQRWEEQAMQIEQEYPNLQVRAALKDPEFRKLLQAPYNLDLETAYRAKYGDRMIEAAVEKATKKVTDSVAANKSRPRENGSGKNAGSSLGADPGRMTGAEIREYMKRVERGETISFTK